MFLLPVLVVAISFVTFGINSSRASRIQDIDGGARLIFGRPNDPDVRHRSASHAASQAADGLEDALELANSARNSDPPRYHDAEIAYRLAAKLNPNDPRPLIGLGNIWYDQKQYAPAAKMYQQALSLMTAISSGGGTIRGQLKSAEQRRLSAQLRASFGMALLHTDDFSKAEDEFERAVNSEPTNARWHALLGYDLLKQGKKADAIKAFREAVRLDSGNSEYQKLLQSTQE